MKQFDTHEVTNQATAFEDVNLYTSDTALRESVEAADGTWARDRLTAFGETTGSAAFRDLGRQANRFSPELKTFDRFGHRIDEVDFHPAWHEVMRTAMEHEVHNLPWRHPGPGAHVARSAMHSMLSQVESGSCCPLTMTFASRPALAQQPDVAARLDPALLGTEYRHELARIEDKPSILIGMAMTEKQGGSDVRANTTTAAPSGDSDGSHALVGHKWFCSAPMSDAFLTLAQTGDGITCFLVPRVLDDGSRNPLRIQRLKDKLGNRSNASSEIEYTGTRGFQLGESGRGIRTILEMVHHTRLDCVSGSTGLMRQALAQALHHTAGRAAFGKPLIDQPIMRSVLADLALEVEAATALMVRLAQAFDRAPDDDGERAFARIATAVGKYWVCKRAPSMIYEAMECLGGAGYVEESILPRLFREAPVNTIWEGSGNVMCLDVLRAIGREPGAIDRLFEELRAPAGSCPALAASVDALEEKILGGGMQESDARSVVEGLAISLQASLLVRSAPDYVADAFVKARLEDRGFAFGTLNSSADTERIVARARPTA